MATRYKKSCVIAKRLIVTLLILGFWGTSIPSLALEDIEIENGSVTAAEEPYSAEVAITEGDDVVDDGSFTQSNTNNEAKDGMSDEMADVPDIAVAEEAVETTGSNDEMSEDEKSEMIPADAEEATPSTPKEVSKGYQQFDESIEPSDDAPGNEVDFAAPTDPLIASAATEFDLYRNVLIEASRSEGIYWDYYIAMRNSGKAGIWLDMLSYRVFDIGNNGTPELLVKFDLSMAQMVTDVYTIKNGSIIHLGSFGNGYMLYGNSHGQLYSMYMHTGRAIVDEISVSEDSMIKERVFDRYYADDATRAGKEAIQYLLSKGAGQLESSGINDHALLEHTAFHGYRFFPDVPSAHWAQRVVSRAATLGLITGYANGNFGPDNKVTRGQVAVILWRMAGQPAASPGAKSFSDVAAGRYYYDAVRWASSAGVVSGYAGGKFGPDDEVTREQLTVMLANYARRVAGLEVSGSRADFSSMRDASSVASYATTAVGWYFRNDILSGSGGNVLPKGDATRAQAAKMLVYQYDMVR